MSRGPVDDAIKPRDYLAEARRILVDTEGQLVPVPERAHLVALQFQINQLVTMGLLKNRALIGMLLDQKRPRIAIPRALVAAIEAQGLDIVVSREADGGITFELLRPAPQSASVN